MKAFLGFAAIAAIGALAVARSLSSANAAEAPGTVVQTTQGPMVARYSAMPIDPHAPTFEQLKAGDPRFSTTVGPDIEVGHEARDAIRSQAVAALEALVSVDPCDPIRREAYLAATRRYISAHMADKEAIKGERPSPRWSTAVDGTIGGSLNLLHNEGVISSGDMQRAMFGSSWQSRLMLMIKPPPRSAEERSRCPAPT